MTSALWLGPCSHRSQSLKALLDSAPIEENFAPFQRRFYSQFEIHVVVSEDFETLVEASDRYPHSPQVYICRSENFLDPFTLGVRPLNRYFFIVDQQSPLEFRRLIETIYNTITPSRKKTNALFRPIPSMQNSIAVLKRLTEERLLDLTNFSAQEDERRKSFRTLINLARHLSMSRDIEEAASQLWSELRTTAGIQSISFVLIKPSGQCHQLVTRSGKFHIESLPPLSSNQIEFLERLTNQTAYRYNLHQLEHNDINSLNFLLRRNLKVPFLCTLPSESSDNVLVLLVEMNHPEAMSMTFKEFLRERLLFVHLAIEKHLLQEEIHSKTALWAKTFDGLQDPIAIITQKRSIVRANRQLPTRAGAPCYQTWASIEHQCFQCPQKILKDEFFELQITEKIYQARLFPIYETTSPHAFVAHYVDVTAERTLYSQLLQSEKMVAVSKLAGDLSQALSFPLQKIIQLVEKAFHKGVSTDPTQRDLQEIQKAALRSLRIITDFESFSHGKIEKTPVVAELIIEKTIPLVKALIHGHRFHLQLSETRHPVMASVSLLQQVIYNLMRNAHQAMSGHGEIIITSESQSLGSRAGVKIGVLDSGPGLSAELQKKIFRPFVTSKSSTEGTGLGLNIVKQIVESHGGHVGYEPRKAGGSEFWIWLPLNEQLKTGKVIP